LGNLALITVDAREATKTSILSMLPPDTKTAQLEVGDYVIHGLTKSDIIERKTINDFMFSAQNRLWEQLVAIANVEDYHKWLILEGEYIFDTQTKKIMTLTTFFKRHPDKELTYLTLQASVIAFNVSIIFCKDLAGTAKFLTWLNEKRGMPKEPKSYPLRHGFKKDWDLPTKRVYVYDAFGHETSRALIKAWPDFIDIYKKALARESDKAECIKRLSDITLESGRRIGEKKAQEIAEVLFG
jgi:ERCC4-type nuclease